MLYLVRHAAVTPRPEEPGALWHLSPEGRAAAEQLGAEAYWSDVSMIYTSDEPKAVATAQRLAAPNDLPIRIERYLREVEGRAWVDSGYAEQVHAYLSGDGPKGWEPIDEARSRMRDAIDAIDGRHADKDVGVVSHGIVLALYLSDVVGLSTTQAIELWEGIRFPDVAIFNPTEDSFEREFGA